MQPSAENDIVSLVDRPMTANSAIDKEPSEERSRSQILDQLAAQSHPMLFDHRISQAPVEFGA
jgi:hypothetical protein